MGWIGRVWFGICWNGLDRVGDQIELGWFVLYDCVGLDRVELGFGLHCVGLGLRLD